MDVSASTEKPSCDAYFRGLQMCFDLLYLSTSLRYHKYNKSK